MQKRNARATNGKIIAYLLRTPLDTILALGAVVSIADRYHRGTVE